jgi:nitrite reductase/ring-hydroxylating ferredoxin subunit
MSSVPNELRDGALIRNQELVVAGVYEREIRASIESVWENVLDWEHLPWLHDQAFQSIEPRSSGDWGWTATVGFAGDAQAEIELVVDREAGHYVARTVAGVGAPGEIWTFLEPVAPGTTSIRVEFWVTPIPEEGLAKVGAAYVALYTGLWDQDEEMMQTRELAFARREKRGAEMPPDEPSAYTSREGVDLGPLEALRRRLPLVVEFAGHRYRVIDLEGELVAHSTECPHWLGPLEDCAVEAGDVVCPWHGYRFDVATGRSSEGRSLKLRTAPRAEIDEVTQRVRLVEAGSGENCLGK